MGSVALSIFTFPWRAEIEIRRGRAGDTQSPPCQLARWHGGAVTPSTGLDESSTPTTPSMEAFSRLAERGAQPLRAALSCDRAGSLREDGSKRLSMPWVYKGHNRDAFRGDLSWLVPRSILSTARPL